MADETKQSKKPEYNMAEEIRYQNILLEEMRSNYQLLSEGLIGLGERMDRRFDEQDARMNSRFDDLETVVRKNSQDINGLQQDVSGLKQDVSGLKQDVGGLKQGVHKLQVGLDTLNVKFDRLEARVERHDDDIVTLKAAVGIRA